MQTLSALNNELTITQERSIDEDRFDMNITTGVNHQPDEARHMCWRAYNTAHKTSSGWGCRFIRLQVIYLVLLSETTAMLFGNSDSSF